MLNEKITSVYIGFLIRPARSGKNKRNVEINAGDTGTIPIHCDTS